MRTIPEIGDKVEFKKFAYNNERGGTELSEWHKEFDGKTFTDIVVKAWEDYETGWRFWVSPENALALKIHYDKIYLSEFDIVGVEQHEKYKVESRAVWNDEGVQETVYDVRTPEGDYLYTGVDYETAKRFE
ncbi:MAG: hypothetical protein ACRD2L_23765 [Terriglobia bacterium]